METIKPINRLSIESIPRPKIFSSDLDIVVQNTCKKVLELSMSRADGFKFDEVAILVDIRSHKILHTMFGLGGEINILEDEDYFEITTFSDKNSIIMVHNHPNDSKLSYNDLTSLVGTPSMLGVIAVGNSGGISYSIKTSADSNYYRGLLNAMANRVSKNNPDRISIYKMGNRILGNKNLKLKSGYSRRRKVHGS